jgi:hypothetical protein
MTDNNLLPFSFPIISHKQVTAAFDGGLFTSDGGVMLLAMAERRLGIDERLASGRQLLPRRPLSDLSRRLSKFVNFERPVP